MPEVSADIIVVGAGVAGATTAAVLSRQGWRVLLLDARSDCAPVFKAEKILHDELVLLRECRLLEPLLPYAGLISELCEAYDGRIFRRNRVEQIGITYPDLVNTLRANLPPEVETGIGRVTHIAGDGNNQCVELDDGDVLTARLVVLACGIGGSLPASLGLRRHVIQKEQCVTLGFNVVATSRPFPFETVTYFPSDAADCIDYLTLFKIRDTMRANLFTFRSGNHPWIREFHKTPRLSLERALPKLTRVTGEFGVVGKVDCGRMDLYRMEGAMPDGVVLVGDALQSACPSSGLGLKKAFTDVRVLAECVPAWFSTPGMSAAKLSAFYDHPRKRAMDAYVLRDAHDRRSLACDPSPRWRIRRALLHLRWNLPLPKFAVRVARRLSRKP